MTDRRIYVIVALGIAYLSIKHANAEEGLSLGVGAAYSESEYKDYKNKISPFPLINYEGDYLYINSMSAGLFIYKDEQNSLKFGASYYPKKFDPSDSDDPQLGLLEKRNSTMMVDLIYSNHSELGNISASISGDGLNKTDGGIKGNVNYNYNFSITPDLMFIPGFGADWTNDKFNNYYYGVSEAESINSGLSFYSPKQSITPYAQVTTSYNITKALSIFISGKYNVLPDELKNSPMVNMNYLASVSTGFSYKF